MPTNEIELIVGLNQATGEVSVSGPLENKLMAYGLLEAAKDAIREHHTAAPKIMPVRGTLAAVPPNGA